MSDILIRVRQNNRMITRGAYRSDTIGRVILQAGKGETIKATYNLADWLNGATVSSSALANSGPTVTKTEASGVFTLTASGYGTSDLTITASDGRVRVERFLIEQPDAERRDDYGA